MTKFQLQTFWFKLTNRFRKNKVIFDEDYIHEYFELSYAHYLVLPRTLLQSMPAKWQKEFVKLLEEFEERFTAFEWLPEGTNYNVQLKDRKGVIHSINEDIFNDYERGRRTIVKGEKRFVEGKERYFITEE